MITGINKVLAQEKCGAIVQEKLTIIPTPVASRQDVWEAVNAFAFEAGWLCLTDRVVQLGSSADLEKIRGGIILSGELAKGRETLHIRQSTVGWTLTRFIAGEGEPCLMLKEEYISTENQQQERLRYDVYWKLVEGSYRPWAGRFTGFATGGATQ